MIYPDDVSIDPETGLPIDITSPGGPPPGGYDTRDPNAYYVDPQTGLYDPYRAQPTAGSPPAPTPTTSPTPGAPPALLPGAPVVPARPATQAGRFFDFPYFTPPEFKFGAYEAPTPFSYPEFVGPTAETFTADPGYDFRVKEGMRPIINLKAAQGVLRSPGTLKGLMEYGQGLASQEFGNVFNRQFNTWQANKGLKADIYDRDVDRRMTNYKVGYNEAADLFNRSLATYGANFNTAATGAGLNLNAQGQQTRNLLSLYDLATRSLPTFTPTAVPGG